MALIITEGRCPKCGSKDIAEYGYFCQCKSCRHIEARQVASNVVYKAVNG